MRLPWMSRSDRRQWQVASTLAELGELMARWLEGEIESQPGYQPRCGPDEETSELIPALAAANRAGYVTANSQPGHGPLPGFDGLLWRQRACVDGFVDDPQLLRRLVDAAEDAGLRVVIRDLLDRPNGAGVPVTIRGENIHTACGSALGARDLALIWRGCNSRALEAVAASAQLTLIDPEYADNTRLWDVLVRVAAGEPAPAPEDDEDDDLWLDEGVMTECTNCGAPYHGSRLYCSDGCEIADSPCEDDEPRCVECGCTDNSPCPGGCWWVPNNPMTDRCSACVRPVGLVAGTD